MTPRPKASEGQQVVPIAALLSAHGWRNFLLVIAPLVVVVLLYSTSARVLAEYWNDTESLTYTHGWLVLAIALWLLFDALSRGEVVRVQGSWLGGGILFAASLIWLLARQVNIQTIQLMLLPVLLDGALWSLYGVSVARRCGFALAYLYFALPWWGEINFLLQWGTVFAMRALVRVVGIPAYFDANAIHLPSGVITVEGGCSGLHFFIVALAIATLYWYVNRIAAKWRLLLLAATLAILSNWLRVLVIVVAGYLTNMQHYLVRVEHYRFGWGVFAVMMVVFMFIANRMRQTTTNAADGSTALTVPIAYPSLIGFVVALLMVPGYVYTLQQRVVPRIESVAIVPPAGWQPSEITNWWMPVFNHADASIIRHFTKGGVQLDAYRAMYGKQNQQQKVAGFDNSPFGVLPSGIAVVATTRVAGPFIETELSDALGNRELVWTAYHVDARWFSNALRAQLWSGIKALAITPHTGVIALHARCESRCDTTRQALAEWATVSQLNMFVQEST